MSHEYAFVPSHDIPHVPQSCLEDSEIKASVGELSLVHGGDSERGWVENQS